MNYERGDWKVTRYCCTSGLCFECHRRKNAGTLKARRRVVQGEGYSRGYAEFVAKNWCLYDAKAVQQKGDAR